MGITIGNITNSNDIAIGNGADDDDGTTIVGDITNCSGVAIGNKQTGNDA